MPELPRGTVTFLFTDIEGSTALWERDRGRWRPRSSATWHPARGAIAAHGGVHFKTIGDACRRPFPTAPAASPRRWTAQRRFWRGLGRPIGRCACAWRCTPARPHRMRAGITWPPALNRFARLLAAGHGGQILLSQAVAATGAWRPAPAAPRCAISASTGCATCCEPERVYQLAAPGLAGRLPAAQDALTPDRNNLPPQPTPFLGREREVERDRRSASRAGRHAC